MSTIPIANHPSTPTEMILSSVMRESEGLGFGLESESADFITRDEIPWVPKMVDGAANSVPSNFERGPHWYPTRKGPAQRIPNSKFWKRDKIPIEEAWEGALIITWLGESSIGAVKENDPRQSAGRIVRMRIKGEGWKSNRQVMTGHPSENVHFNRWVCRIVPRDEIAVFNRRAT